jgi:hypothetical protein
MTGQMKGDWADVDVVSRKQTRIEGGLGSFSRMLNRSRCRGRGLR